MPVLHGVSVALYAVVQQEHGTTQGLVCAKSRLAKRSLTIPRLELVAGHMAIKLATNVKIALTTFPIPTIHCWLDFNRGIILDKWSRGVSTARMKQSTQDPTTP